MAESGIVKGMADEYTDSTPLNQLEFLIKTLTRDMSTAIPVIITQFRRATRTPPVMSTRAH